jgi:hypothetical protein
LIAHPEEKTKYEEAKKKWKAWSIVLKKKEKPEAKKEK